MSTVSNPVRAAETIGRLIPNKEGDKIPPPPQIFKFLEINIPQLTWQEGAHFYTDGIKVGIVIDSDVVKWNKTIEEIDMKPDLQNLSVKRKLEDSDNKDQLCLKKI